MIVIVNCCGNNIASIRYALARLGQQALLSTDKNLIRAASHVILPGVGHAQRAMSELNKLDLIDTLIHLTQPVLGICLGMQLLYDYSEEGEIACLGILPGTVKKLASKPHYSTPHMGWNQLQFISDTASTVCPTLQDEYVYFVHSYCAPVNEFSIAITEYTQRFTAMVRYNNFWGMQFHPERSAAAGEKLLTAFLQVR